MKSNWSIYGFNNIMYKAEKNVEHFIKLIDGVDLNTHIVFKRNDLGANLAYKISESLGGNHVNKF